MLGLQGQIIPTVTGRMFFVVTGLAQNVDNASTFVTLRVGSGEFAYPHTGDPVTGTQVGFPAEIFAPGLTIPFTLVGHIDVTPTPLDAYPFWASWWVDVSVKASTGSGAGVSSVYCLVMEL